MPTQKYFTIEEADEIIPEINFKLKEVKRIKNRLLQMDIDEEELFECIESSIDDPEIVQAFDFFIEIPKARPLINKIVRLVGDILDYGVVIKDLDLGLIDFPSWFQGREVYLCHKAGEDRVKYWHELDEGFRGRQPILELDMMLDEPILQ